MDIAAYLAERHRILLNEQQKQAIDSSDGAHTLLLAVPGSGKTTVLVARVAGLLLNHSVPPERILILTFNRETAGDMQKRFSALFGELAERLPRFSTIHSFCLSVLRFYGKKMNRPLPALLSEEKAGEKQEVLREIYRRRTGEYPADDVYESLERSIGYAKNMLMTREDMQQAEFDIERFPTMFADYEDYKRKNRRMDFDDMLTLTLEIFQKFPAILRFFQERYSDILVDEAQDTSLAQHRILQLLSARARMFMVGDEDQSIYSFRGAYPQALLSFSQDYPDSRILKMEQNYRCARSIASCANRFIRQNRQRYPKEMAGQRQEEGSIEVIPLRDYSGQYERTLSLLEGLPRGKRAAVLYRNNESAIPLIDLFYRKDIPFYVKESRLSFFTSAAIRDLQAYFQLAIDPTDLDAFSQIYYKLGYARDVYLFVKERAGGFGNLFDCVLEYPLLKKWQQYRAVEYKRTFAGLRLMRPAQAIDVVEQDLNYDSFIESRMSEGSVKTQTYQKLNAAKCLAGGLRSIFDFLDKLSSMKQALQERRLVDPASPILLSTLHSAKGMEFDTVILLDLLQHILPDSDSLKERRMGKMDAYESEVRLFYVGATRAKDRLVCFTSDRLNGNDAAPSIFLSDFLRGPKPPEESAPPAGREGKIPDLVGRKVVHTLFDEGRVLSQQGDIIQVDFRMFGRKKLNISICLDNGYLQIESKETQK